MKLTLVKRRKMRMQDIEKWKKIENKGSNKHSSDSYSSQVENKSLKINNHRSLYCNGPDFV